MSAPTRLQRRAALLEQRRALRLRLKAQVAAHASHPLFVAARARRRKARQRRTIAALIALLLLLLLLRCETAESPAEEPVMAVADPEEAAEKPAPPKKAPRRPKRALVGEIDTSDRDAMAVAPTTAPPWLPQFRLQVAARSPRLAACFNGVEKPGALQWSALVHANSGRVSESVIEPAFRGLELNQQQHDCLVAALTDPPFELDEPSPEAAARRVSLIFEF